MMTPKKSFPSRKFEPNDVERHDDVVSEVGDQRGGAIYVYSEKVKLAVRVALVTGRPLLVRGAPGWGKSSLAGAVAKHMNWRYLEKVISSRTQARDLMSELDLVRRLSDAQGGKGVDSDWRRYIRPGVLWKAFDPVGADLQERYFARSTTDGAEQAASGQGAEPVKPAVVLLDEMDKADPDVPNNLLVALGSLQFEVDEIGPPPVKALPEAIPLIIVTTNDERDLPRAFLRRCVEIQLPALDGADEDGSQRKRLLVEIGAQHLDGELDRTFVQKIANTIVDQAKSAPADDGLIIPSPAEFIDTLLAVRDLYGKDANEADIAAVIRIAVRKRGLSGSL
jgi:MoxR-like ATPase